MSAEVLKYIEQIQKSIQLIKQFVNYDDEFV